VSLVESPHTWRVPSGEAPPCSHAAQEDSRCFGPGEISALSRTAATRDCHRDCGGDRSLLAAAALGNPAFRRVVASGTARQTELTILPVPTRIDRGDAFKLAGYFFAAAFFAAQRFFKAATIAALPAALSTRFFLMGFATFGAFVST
jgi:hypothetical protein